ncbi:hypothetical protein RP20_CCG012710 [Aedes albopictus]|nr:hypothetical protein RP20_CCG012710 [Aedes albopictus]
MDRRYRAFLPPVGENPNAGALSAKVYSTTSRFLSVGGAGLGFTTGSAEIITVEDVLGSPVDDDICLLGRISRLYPSPAEFRFCGAARVFATATAQKNTLSCRHPLDDTQRRRVGSGLVPPERLPFPSPWN